MAENLDTRDPLKSAHLIISGQFKFRHLSEAKDLAEYLSAACPNPTLSAIGICEIFLNAIEHGNLAIGFEEKTKLQSENNWLEEIDKRLALPENIQKYVLVEFNRNETEISIKVTDQGNGFDWHKYQEATKSIQTHGRGLIMAKSLTFKKLDFSEKGNQVTCIIPLT